jgi:hypothetical protein
MWKKIAFVQLIILVALLAFWMGSDSHGAERLRREFVTQNPDGDTIYIWAYHDAGVKHYWNVTRLDFETAQKNEKNIQVR